MGSPSYFYREILREYIRMASMNTACRSLFPLPTTKELSEKELENLALRYFHKNPIDYYNIGVATTNILYDHKDNTDAVNAWCSGANQIAYFFGIEESDE